MNKNKYQDINKKNYKDIDNVTLNHNTRDDIDFDAFCRIYNDKTNNNANCGFLAYKNSEDYIQKYQSYNQNINSFTFNVKTDFKNDCGMVSVINMLYHGFLNINQNYVKTNNTNPLFINRLIHSYYDALKQTYYFSTNVNHIFTEFEKHHRELWHSIYNPDNGADVLLLLWLFITFDINEYISKKDFYDCEYYSYKFQNLYSSFCSVSDHSQEKSLVFTNSCFNGYTSYPGIDYLDQFIGLNNKFSCINKIAVPKDMKSEDSILHFFYVFPYPQHLKQHMKYHICDDSRQNAMRNAYDFFKYHSSDIKHNTSIVFPMNFIIKNFRYELVGWIAHMPFHYKYYGLSDDLVIDFDFMKKYKIKNLSNLYNNKLNQLNHDVFYTYDQNKFIIIHNLLIAICRLTKI